jgi:hypothetical protein
VTAVCYRPDGKGAVAGTITGNCRYYDTSDNHLELESQVSLNGRKKSPHKRIVGFQYCPSDPKKLMVTSGDSQVRILDGVHVISNYKGTDSLFYSRCNSKVFVTLDLTLLSPILRITKFMPSWSIIYPRWRSHNLC